MVELEPPSTRSPSLQRLFRVGRDSRGNWVAQDQQGLCGPRNARAGQGCNPCWKDLAFRSR